MRIDQSTAQSSRMQRRLHEPTRPSHWIAAAVVLFIALLLIGAMPGYATGLSNAAIDNVLHAFGYGLLTIFLFNGSTGIVLGRALSALLTIGLLSAVDEAIQSFISYRSANLRDWYFDMLASLVCVAILVLYQLTRIVAAKERREHESI